MAAHLPFVNNPTTSQLVGEFYADSEFIRVPLEKMDRLHETLPRGPQLWIDPGIDGFHRPFLPLEANLDKSAGKEWRACMRRFPNCAVLADAAFQSKPVRGEVEAFVAAILDKCNEYRPAMLTVPQLPIIDGASRNRINRVLAEATAKWKARAKYKGKLILPAVFTNQRQLNLKTPRRAKQTALMGCYEKAEANGLWTVDSSLSDQKGESTFAKKRFPGLVAFHEEIGEQLPVGAMTIAGPYWGMNLVLWARGLCDYPAIGIGSAYQYHIAGGAMRRSSIRLAIPPLRRWAQTGASFRKWLTQAVNDIDPADKAYAAFDELSRDYSKISTTAELARRQVAQFYKQWCKEIESTPPGVRAPALYQMLSSAYVLGNALRDLPAAEKRARPSERVAEYLMLNCL